MTFTEILNSEMDLGSLTALARQGLSWWLDELSTMLPAGWRESLSSRPSQWIEPVAAGRWRLWRQGRPSDLAAGTSLGKARVGLLAPNDAVLTREIPAPRLPAADIRRMVALDIDRLSPLPPEMIHYDVAILRDGADGQRVLVGIIGRDDAARLLAEARLAGHAPVALAAPADAEGASPRFDFLPQVLEAAGGAPVDRVRFYAWIAAGSLILANLGVLVGRDIIETSRLRSAVEAQAPGVAVVQRLRRRIATEDSRRRDMIIRGVSNDPLRLMNALTVALPSGAFVQHLEWNGHTLRLVGYRHESVDLAGVIARLGRFGPPRVLSTTPAPAAAAQGGETQTAEAPGAPAPATPYRPFDLSADVKPAGPK